MSRDENTDAFILHGRRGGKSTLLRASCSGWRTDADELINVPGPDSAVAHLLAEDDVGVTRIDSFSSTDRPPCVFRSESLLYLDELPIASRDAATRARRSRSSDRATAQSIIAKKFFPTPTRVCLGSHKLLHGTGRRSSSFRSIATRRC